jgi:adenylate cyclase
MWLRQIHRLLRSYRLWTVLAGLALTGILWFSLLGYLPIGIVATGDRLIQDQRLRWRPVAPAAQVLIVDIDEKSLAEEGRWTWPRKRLADLVDRIVDKGQARVLGFDVVFAEPLPQEDEVFARALAGRPVVLGYYFTSDNGGRRIGQLPAPVMPVAGLSGVHARPLIWDGYGANRPGLAAAAASSGFFNAVVDPDGVVRSVPLLAVHDGRVYESLAVAMLRVALGGRAAGGGHAGAAPLRIGSGTLGIGDLRIPFAHDLTARVPFAGAAGPGAGRIAYLSASDVLSGAVDPAVFKDRVVLVGASAQGIGDFKATPVHRVTPGVEVQATLLAGALSGDLASEPWHGSVLMALVTLVLGATLSCWIPLLAAGSIAAVGIGSVVLLYGANLVAFQRLGWILPTAGPLLLVLLIAVMNLAVGHFVEGKARRAVIELFGQYVSPELVRRMARRPQAYPIESQNRNLTILFADIRGFTRIAESMDPQSLREYLNRFLTKMTEVVHRHEGTVDKYMGDAIMAFWGAPIEDPLQEDHAVAAALDMQRAVVTLNEEFAERGWPALAIGVGVNSGTARVGDMGSQLRRTYTAIGDAVNLAARFESLTKHFGLPILVGEATARRVTSIELASLGDADVPGRTERVRVYCPKSLVKARAPVAEVETV